MTTIDKDQYFPYLRSAPCENVAAIAVGDLADVTRAIRCNEAGTLTVNTFGGQTGVVMHFAAGETRYVRVVHVSAMTGITNAEAMW
jgi:hypothetical protein